MRDARVEDVDHVSDSDTDDKDESGPSGLHSESFTIGVFPSHQSPIYLHLSTKQEKVRARLFSGSFVHFLGKRRYTLKTKVGDLVLCAYLCISFKY